MARIPPTTATITFELGQVALAEYRAEMGSGPLRKFPDVVRAALDEYIGYGLIRPQLAKAIMDLSDAEVTQEKIHELVFQLARTRDKANRAGQTNRLVTEPGQP